MWLDVFVDGQADLEMDDLGYPHLWETAIQTYLDSGKLTQLLNITILTGWWFGTFFIFPNSWDDDPI